jgi:drug/metabolite transporter (DMT)-like permease
VRQLQADFYPYFLKMLVFYLIIFGALLHATWNVIVKKHTDILSSMGAMCFFIALFSFFGLFFFPLPDKESWIYLLLSTLVHWFYKWNLIRLYKIGNLNVVYPIFRGLAPILFLFFAIPIHQKFLWQNLQLQELVAIALILISVLGIDSDWRRLLQKNISQSLKIAFLVSCSIAFYSSLDSKASQLTNPHSYIVWLFFLDNSLFFLFCFLKKKKIAPFFQQNAPQAVAAGFCNVFAYWVIVYAFSISNSLIVVSLREISIVFAVLLTSIFLKEKFSFKKLIFASCIFVGVFLLKANF